MKTGIAKSEESMIRTVAGMSRKLDLDLSPLQAIDRLHKLHEKFKDHWTGTSPWLVLPDCFTLPVEMPVGKMLEEIKKHGEPIGIAGVAWLSTKRVTVFRMPFCEDAKSRKTVEQSAQAAEKLVHAALDETIQEIKNLPIHEGASNEPTD